MTKKEKQIIADFFVMSTDATAQALCYEYATDDEAGFQERFGCSSNEALKVLAKFINKLHK